MGFVSNKMCIKIVNLILVHVALLLVMDVIFFHKSDIPFILNFEFQLWAFQIDKTTERLLRLFLISIVISPFGTLFIFLMNNIKVQKIITVFSLIVITVIVFNEKQIVPAEPLFSTTEQEGILIAHAGGKIDSYTYSNSEEALIQSLKAGYRFIEIDMLVTDDRHIIGAHDWENFAKVISSNARTLSEIKKYKVHDKLTVLHDETIKKYFLEYPNTYLVTDKIADYKLLVESFPFYHDRLLVEVFTLNDYIKALREGIRYPMLCIWDEQGLQKFYKLLDRGVISIITCPVGLIEKAPLQLQKLHNSGVNIFAFTTNDADFIEEHLGKTVSGFYTDSIFPKEILYYEK